ncbi:RNA polymerase sigma-70 factor [Flavivirga amylovorans]|uniref:RNA polymerase sigma-70 factor n=1 Tax=Flavivirga amylovorans TaxID=870486 RepID=A0ABT8WYI3_9FLAO|nr:RNA polymerase sigma-70 factor [Flavivirga amylovorans]MDO5986528.1 RNA polymerase sigma-70 factor [Flavivirga amylovorans]
MDQNKTHELTMKEFENIFNRLYESLCLIANKYVNDLDLSEDIVQDVFIKAWENKVPFKNKNKIEGFFYTAVKNKSLDFLRSKYAKDVETYSSEGLETLQTERYFLRESVIIETSSLVERALELLPDKCAEAMRLSIESYTNKEIADEMDISVNTVKDHKKVAYKKLRKMSGYLGIT